PDRSTAGIGERAVSLPETGRKAPPGRLVLDIRALVVGQVVEELQLFSLLAHGNPITFSDSMPRSSTIFTATLRLSPGSNGRLTVPCSLSSRDSSSSALISLRSLFQPSLAPAMGKKTWRGTRQRSS